MQSNPVLNEGKKRLIGFTFPLHLSRRYKRWKILQDFFETNDHGSSLGKQLPDFKSKIVIYCSKGSEFIGKRSFPLSPDQPRPGYFLKQCLDLPGGAEGVLHQSLIRN